MSQSKKVIQFLHPGEEYKISSRKSIKNGLDYKFYEGSKTKGVKLWNSGDHHRKFLLSRGDYIMNLNEKPIRNRELYYWGEWEPHSEFELITDLKHDNKMYPHHVHRPFFSEQFQGLQNTDPFIFGDHFYYSICKQIGQYAKILQNLDKGSLILFGSEFGSGVKACFVLDTVFVVGDANPIGQNTFEVLQEKTGTLYSKCVLDKISVSNTTLYTAVNYKRTYNGRPFSYFPCKPYPLNNMFSRLVISHKKHQLRDPGARTGIYEIKVDNVEKFWRELTNDVINQGFALGIKAYEPPTKNINYKIEIMDLNDQSKTGSSRKTC